MITAQGPKVLEFNVRFGDPETQVILPLLDGDLAELFEAVYQEKLLTWIQKNPQEISKKSAVCIVLASQGYPGNYEKGKKICGLETYDPLVFHAGTALKNNEYVTSGGRVLGVVAVDEDLTSAIKKAYDKVLQFYFEGMQYRKDIGLKALTKQRSAFGVQRSGKSKS
jgi:phosphoribosylamine--glycine ligase